MASRKPLTAEVKAARASQQQATQLGIEQSMARTRSISRGAYGTRSLRGGAAGMSLDSTYGIGKFKDDPGALQRIFGGGYVPPAATFAPTPSPKPRAQAKPKAPTPKVKKNPTRNQNIPQKGPMGRY